jgi:hypothetical protein
MKLRDGGVRYQVNAAITNNSEHLFKWFYDIS